MPINSELNQHTLIICANMLLKRGDSFLVIKRSPKKIIAPNIIHTIGGKVDTGEDPSDAAQRELKEEAGLAAQNVRLRGVVTEIKPEGMPNWQIFHFIGDYVSGEPKKTEEGELLWMTAVEIAASPLFPSVARIISALLDETHGPVFGRYLYNEQDDLLDGNFKILAK